MPFFFFGKSLRFDRPIKKNNFASICAERMSWEWREGEEEDEEKSADVQCMYQIEEPIIIFFRAQMLRRLI